MNWLLCLNNVLRTFRKVPCTCLSNVYNYTHVHLNKFLILGKRGSAVCRKQEKMWGHYHCLRTSNEFKIVWEGFLSNIDEPASPTFIQHITHVIFKQLIKKEFPVKDVNCQTPLPAMTHMEENALRCFHNNNYTCS